MNASNLNNATDRAEELAAWIDNHANRALGSMNYHDDGKIYAEVSRNLRALSAARTREAELAKALKETRAQLVAHGHAESNIECAVAVIEAALQSPASQNNPKETKA